MWSYHQPKKNQFKIFLSCLIVCIGIDYTRTLVKLQHEVIGGTMAGEIDVVAIHLRDSVKRHTKNHANATGTGGSTASLPRFNKTSAAPTQKFEGREQSTTEALKQEIKNLNHSSLAESLVANNTTPAEILEFARQDGVVIVTKVHGPHQLGLLRQSMCLLHHAYNNKVNYDIVVFTTLPIPETETLLADTRSIISPAKLTVVVDNDGLDNEIRKLSPIRRENFLKRCNVTSPEEITWDSECYEEGVGMGRIKYNWQAEFRSLHIWKHESLRDYRYMMWIDTDAFCTQGWDRDPIALAMKNRIVIYFENYPQGRNKAAQKIVKEVFGKYLCGARKTPNGPMTSWMGDDCGGSVLWTIHGFNHITDLDFFRQDEVMHWAERMIGDCYLCRKFDDQLAVTVPSFVLAPERSWDLYKSGVRLNIFHNHNIDGKRNKKAGGFHQYWKKNAEVHFPEAWNKCIITEGG